MKLNFLPAGACLVCTAFLIGCLSRQTVSVSTTPEKKYGAAQILHGTGESYDSAVVITGGKDYAEAVACEDIFISNSWGIKEKDWRLVEKTTVTENKRTYDMVQVEIPKVGEKHFYYFDITHYKKKPKARSDEETGETERSSAPQEKQAPRQAPQPSKTEVNPTPQANDTTAAPAQHSPQAQDTLAKTEKK
ncbi:MAG TPA: hypothetical protein VLX68_00615 [Chitinivibrionales bacterium]|nr:hypothetical protein [Chitinivibrionales bacterium]